MIGKEKGRNILIDVSVIVPVYNMAKNGNLQYCLDSLVNQTLENFEVIAVDDGSKDNSLEIIREYEKKYPGRVVGVASPENRRQGGARNLGLNYARGRFIGFMDADDWVVPDMYERMLKKAEETGADVVGTDMCRVYEHTMTKTAREACNILSQVGVIDDERRKSILMMPGPLGTKIYERHIFYKPEFKFIEKIAYEDNAASSELVMRFRHFEYIPEVMVYYYQNPESTTHTFSKTLLENRITAGREYLRTSKVNGAADRFKEEVEYQFIKLFYQNTLFSYMLSSEKKEYAFVNNLGKELKKEFPDFQNNRYYLETTNDEEKKLIKLQQKSTLLFIIFFQLKKYYRKARYGRW